MPKKTQDHTDICSHQTDLLFNGISSKVLRHFLWNSENNYTMYSEDGSLKISLYENRKEIPEKKKKKNCERIALPDIKLNLFF